MRLLVLISLLLAAVLSIAAEETPSIYICEASNPDLLGVYVAGKSNNMDDAPVFSNEKEMSFFRNRGFWYLGSLATWPPETHYRCVEPEGCNFGIDVPPTNEEGDWKGSKRFNDGVPPVIRSSPCHTASFDEL
eukprot:gene29272-35339_t